jgi:hypothetical protein
MAVQPGIVVVGTAGPFSKSPLVIASVAAAAGSALVNMSTPATTKLKAMCRARVDAERVDAEPVDDQPVGIERSEDDL